MMDQRFALFETTIGTCGIVWTARGIAGCSFQRKTRRRRAQGCIAGTRPPLEAEPNAEARRAIDGIVALLSGLNGDRPVS